MASLPFAQEIEGVTFGTTDLAALMKQLDAREAAGDNLSEDRRSEPRVRCRSFAIMTMLSGERRGAAYMIPLRNISRGGVAFLFNAPLEKGTRCSFRIVKPAGETMDTTGRIVRSNSVRKGAFETAIQLDEPIDLDLGA